jgi:hypothetical protein
MKQFGWARAPLILGYILGKLIEKYLFISMGRYQFEWLHRPGVIGIFIVTLLVLARPLITYLYQVMRPAPAPAVAADGNTAVAASAAEPEPLVDRIAGPGLWVVATLGFAFAFAAAMSWPLAARLMPMTAAVAGLVVIACSALTVFIGRMRGEVMETTRASHDIGGGYEGLTQGQIYGRFAVLLLWLIGLLFAVLAIGMLPSLALFMFLYLITQGGTRVGTALLIVVPILAGMYLLFVKLLHVPWPPSLLGDMVPALRAFTGRLL